MRKTIVLSAVLGLVAAVSSAQDPAKVAPKQCKIAFENDYVRVLRWTETPGDKTPMHEHPAMVTISLSAGKTRFTSPDGKSTVVDAKAGQVTWSDPEKHSSENLGTRPGEVIQVELKKAPPAAMTTLAASEDSASVDPKHYKVEFQNDRVRVLRIHYGPKEKSVMHGHPASVAVFLTPIQSKFTFPDGKTSTADMKPGDVRWSDKQQHLPENLGGKPFELIEVELR